MRPTREDVCAYVESNFDDLRLRALTAFAERLERMTPEDVRERFMKAGEKYGEFDVDSICTSEEIEAEHLDLVSYHALSDLQADS